MDITLTKQIGASSAVKITETNGAIEISIEVPENLINIDASIVRTYKMMRIHEGQVDILDVEFDEETGRLVFETDAFSTYVLIYSDVPALIEAPKTGDDNIAWFYIVLATCGLVILFNNKKSFVQE